MNRAKANRRPLLRTPSQLYQVIKSSSLENQCEDSDFEIIGPEFVVRSKETPLAICLLNKNYKKTSQASKVRKVTIVKLSGKRLEVTCNAHTTRISHLFEALATEEEKYILHTGTLGIAKLIQGEFHFIPSRTKLYKVAPKGWKEDNETRNKISFDNFTLYLHFLLYPRFRVGVDEETLLLRHLYLQFRHDLINGKLYLPATELLRLASLALLVEFGNARNEDNDYFLVEHFLPRYFLASHRPCSDLRDLHSDLCSRGVSRKEAKRRFVLDAQSVPFAGTHFYQTLSGCNKYWLGANRNGLYILEEPPSMQSLGQEFLHPWDHVKKLSKSSCRNMILHLQGPESIRKLKFIFKQSDGCSSVVHTFKTLWSHYRRFGNESSQMVSCPIKNNESIPEMTENLLPESIHENGSSARVDVISTAFSSNGTESKEDLRERESEESFRFRRNRGCRNWWKKSSGLLLGGRNSFKSSSRSSSFNSCIDGEDRNVPDAVPDLKPEVSRGAVALPDMKPEVSRGPEAFADMKPEIVPGNDSPACILSSQQEEFKRFVDESFSVCESPLRPRVDIQDGSVDMDPSVIQMIQSTSLMTQTSLIEDNTKVTRRISATGATQVTQLQSTSVTQATQDTQSQSTSVTRATQVTQSQSTSVTQSHLTPVTQLHSTPVTQWHSTPVTSALSPSVVPYTAMPLHSPTRTSLGVRMGTRVPNALINKHKFIGVESPPATPARTPESGSFAPLVVEPSSPPCETPLNETLSESLLSRFMKAPSHPGVHERRLTTVTLKKKDGLLGILVGVGEDTALYVQGITPGGPAEEQGVLKPGDRFVGVNGLSVDSLPYGHTIDLLRKAPDNEVCLIVSQPLRENNLNSTINDVSSTEALPFIESRCSNVTGKYVTVIPISPSNETEVPSLNRTPKRLLYLYQEQV